MRLLVIALRLCLGFKDLWLKPWDWAAKLANDDNPFGIILVAILNIILLGPFILALLALWFKLCFKLLVFAGIA